MAGGKNNTERIEILEGQAANMTARLDVHDTIIQGLKANLDKGTVTIEGHAKLLALIEEKILVLVDLKTIQAALVALEKGNVEFRKDIEALQKWKDDVKKDRDETSRRLWALMPNLLAALISAVVSIGVVLLAFWLNKPK